MKISPVQTDSFSRISQKPECKKSQKADNQQKNVSFKSIFIQDMCEIGDVSESGIHPKFMQKDSLLLNEIASRYPNQDCYICGGYQFLPKLQYREKPSDVQIFTKNMANEYVTYTDADDPDYPAVTLILNEKEPLACFFGIPTYMSLNPSLPFTVQAGYELHKKLIAKKYEILDAAGKNDYLDLGDKTVMEYAHEAIADEETAVKRYLMESAFQALKDPARADQLYSSNYLKVQTRLTDKRKFDLTTSLPKQQKIMRKALAESEDTDNFDICEAAVKLYPNAKENQDRIKELSDYILKRYEKS